jgi:hypothetical protein
MPSCCYGDEVPGGGTSVVQFELSMGHSAPDYPVTPKPAGSYGRVSTVVPRMKFIWAQHGGLGFRV